MAKHILRRTAAFTVPAKFNRNFIAIIFRRFRADNPFGQSGYAVLTDCKIPNYSQGGIFDYENNEENHLNASRSFDACIVLCNEWL